MGKEPKTNTDVEDLGSLWNCTYSCNYLTSQKSFSKLYYYCVMLLQKSNYSSDYSGSPNSVQAGVFLFIRARTALEVPHHMFTQINYEFSRISLTIRLF